MIIKPFLRTFVTVLIFFLSAVSTSPVLAKRATPIEAAPVTYGGVLFKAPTSLIPMHPNVLEAYVEVYDFVTKKLIKAIPIYEIILDLILEKDVQNIYIRSLRVIEPFLYITNERGDLYRMSLEDYRVNHVITKGSIEAYR